MTPRVTGTNGHAASALAAARHYLRCGVYPIPLLPGQKRCVLNEWDKLRVAEADIDKVFGADSGIGLLLGEPSGGLIDVDLDCREARETADQFLPDTNLIGGRESAVDSHFWYLVDDPPAKASDSFLDPINGKKLLELRLTGGQTVVPPSIYAADPSKGRPKAERCMWLKHGEPARVTITSLRSALGAVAASALLARYWPSGSRDDAALALAGGLLRAGRPVDWVEKFVEAVVAAAQDEQPRDRVRCVADTDKDLKAGKHVTGWPSLEKILGTNGRAVISAVLGWLGIAIGNSGKVTFGGRGYEESQARCQSKVVTVHVAR